MEILRSLTPDDMTRIAEHRDTQTKTPSLQKIRTPHHELARVLSLGASDIEASALTGYSQNRICLLKQDPSFAELLTHYRELPDQKVTDVKERLRVAGLTALEVLSERLEADEEGWTKQELQSFVKLTLVDGMKDTGGASQAPSKPFEINVSFRPVPERAKQVDLLDMGGRIIEQEG